MSWLKQNYSPHPYAPQCGAWDSSPEACLGEKTQQIYSGARRVSGITRDYGYSTTPDRVAADKRCTLPQGKPWVYVSQPRFAGHSTLLSNHTFLIYIYPLYAPTPAPGCPGGRRCLAYGRGVTFCGCSSCASRRRSSSLKSISWGRSAGAWHWYVCRTRTRPCAAHRSQNR